MYLDCAVERAAESGSNDEAEEWGDWTEDNDPDCKYALVERVEREGTSGTLNDMI